MPKVSEETLVLPLGGMSDTPFSSGNELGEQTRNFYPDDEGYLVNYPGKTEYFQRETEGLDDIQTPPAASAGSYTRVITFRDRFGKVQVVFVKDDTLYAQDGNGALPLYQFKGKLVDGKAWPHLFIFQDFLIICNPGDPVLIWDGVEECVPLGVTEIPPAPNLTEHEDPFLRNTPGLTRAPPFGIWPNKHIWPCGNFNFEPHNELAENIIGDDESPSIGYYAWKVQYIDKFGNRGPPSPLSRIVAVHLDESEDVDGHDVKNWILAEFRQPVHDWHIHGIEVYRTLNLHYLSGNTYDSLYRDWNQQNTSQNRYTPRRPDGDIANDLLMDQNILPAPTSDFGCAWGARVVLRDYYRQNRLWYSDEDKFGQFRVTNIYDAKDNIETVTASGDRLLIVTHSTCEILYYDNAGNVRLLEIYENKGSYYGRSFASFRNLVFGLYHDGFFVFDGQGFNKIESPFFLEGDYVDKYNNIQKAIVRGDWYYLAVRHELQSVDNNRVFMYHLPSARWFSVNEVVNDLTLHNENIIGCFSSLFFLYRGIDYPNSIIHLRGLLTEGNSLLNERDLSGMSLLLDPQSNCNILLEFSGDDEYDMVEGDGISYPSRRKVSRTTEALEPYFNKDGVTWEDENTWKAPNDVWIRMNMDKNVSGYKHGVKIVFRNSRAQRVKAIAFHFSAQEGRRGEK